MRSPLGAVLVSWLALSAIDAAPAASAALTRSGGRPPRPGVVLVLLPSGSDAVVAAPSGLRARDASLDATLAALGLSRLERLARGPSRPGRPEVVALHSDRADFDPAAAAAALRGHAGVIAAAPDLRLSLFLVPNDPYLASQWHLSTSVAAVRARQAWDLETGSPGVPIAIVDTGVDTGHPDLTGKLWQNPGEIPGNGLDDDANGYVDDVRGWDFGEDDDDPSPVPFFDLATGIDVGWHGTFVAGLAAAATNNGGGIAGIAWNCPVMALKVADAAGDLPLSAVSAAIAYAIDNGASVLNMSLGAADTAAASFFQPLMTAAFDAGIVNVSAAGNDGTDELNYPAACDSVLSVAATDDANNRAYFSNWGGTVDLAAPGEGLWSSLARNYAYDEFSLLFFEILWGYDDVNPYMLGDGTSFSSPIVAGAAALVRSRFPGLGPLQVMQQLVLNGDVRAYDNPIGRRLNIEKALLSPLGVPPAAAAGGLAFAAPSPNPAAGPVRFAFALPGAGRVTLDVVDAQGRLVRAVLDRDLEPGPQSIAWDGRDRGGRAAAPGLYFAVLHADGARLSRRLAVLR